MVTHDIHRPIPPSTVRISVILGGNSFTVDLPSAKLGATLQAFEDHSGPLSSDRCAAEAAGADDAHVVTSAALWLFLFQPGDQGIMNAGRLGEAIASNGSAMLTATVYETTGEWAFKLFGMPRWPAVVMPSRATKRDLRRRFR
jgi:hypothetical protein